MAKRMLIYRQEGLLDPSYVTIPPLEGAMSGGGTSVESIIDTVKLAQKAGYEIEIIERAILFKMLPLEPQDREIFRKNLGI